ncbi:hypothetical protein M436DRAFT_57491 [Aureobasidium namibiae CBS 147.97]|uniref:Zn(2)-C6 fungal-type domain-containing protein n=1 Tax=Aureobasidium namibiae CBS 147.97 TaxID=1043004 RepID=A0A074WG77_9PEZI|nr:uncharacterized protein M436DRAFT_57491 [Aureobasidium namibiae CBS 147.97]KEQ68882.1 hypothetical protein M436DRAFT_57491 [Aureobasidium namibiae CBS 147.97]
MNSARRIKCDENKEFCNNCVSTGRVCDGYRPLIADAHKISSRPLPLSKPGRLRDICPRTLPSSVILNDAECTALDFFRRLTIFQLPCASSFETPWEFVTLDLADHHPSIAAAACACAALHRTLTGGSDDDRNQFALQQYNKSSAFMRKYIADLSDDVSESAVVVVLVTCLLFFTYETFSGEDNKALLHLEIGLRIIHERLRPRGTAQVSGGRHLVVVDNDLKSMFNVLVQTFIRLDADYMLIGHDYPFLRPICPDPIPPKFVDPDEASLYLEVITGNIFDVYDELFIRTSKALSERGALVDLDEDHEICLVRAAIRTTTLNQRLQEAVEESIRSLQAWAEAFRKVSRTRSNVLSHMTTQIFFFCVSIWNGTWHDANACLVDRFEAQFEYFTGLCERYVKLHIARTPHYNVFEGCEKKHTNRFHTPPAFTLGSGVVTCLATIVEKCRASSVRQRCITLLRKINLRGVFDTDYLAAYLQIIVDHEEQIARRGNSDLDPKVGLQASHVPEDARLVEVVMSPAQHRSRFDFYKTNCVKAIYVVDRDGLQLGQLTAQVTRE